MDITTQELLGLIPTWLEIGKITELAVLVLVVMQYLKTGIPEKLIKPATLVVGVLIAILGYLYAAQAVPWFKAVFNGVLAGIFSDTAYGFLSRKGGTLVLPSRADIKGPTA